MEDHTTGCQSQTPLRCREACWGSGATRSTWGPGPQAWVCQPAGMPLGPSPARVWPSRWHGDQRATDDCAAEDVIVVPDEEGKGCKGLVVVGAIPGQRVALGAGAQEFCNTNQSECMRKCLEERMRLVAVVPNSTHLLHALATRYSRMAVQSLGQV